MPPRNRGAVRLILISFRSRSLLDDSFLVLEKKRNRPGEMALQLRVCAALEEKGSSVPSTQAGWNSSSRVSDASTWPLRHYTRVYKLPLRHMHTIKTLKKRKIHSSTIEIILIKNTSIQYRLEIIHLLLFF